MIPYNRKLERNKFEIILGFLKWFLLDFIKAGALFELLEIVCILFNATKSPHCRKSFSANFDILYAYIVFSFSSLLFYLSFACVKKNKTNPPPPPNWTGPAQSSASPAQQRPSRARTAFASPARSLLRAHAATPSHRQVGPSCRVRHRPPAGVQHAHDSPADAVLNPGAFPVFSPCPRRPPL